VEQRNYSLLRASQSNLQVDAGFLAISANGTLLCSMARHVPFLRYHDDIIILCHSERQLMRCRRRMMTVLRERGLSLSHKKKRMGLVSEGFHFGHIRHSSKRLLIHVGIKELPPLRADCYRLLHH
jgi:hypothetical protein